jgi:hypothetical protein
VKKERRTEIKLITERSISIKSSRSLTALCARCGREVQMFTPGQAALVSGLSSREVYHRVEAGEVHFTETVEGLLLVCLDSLIGYQPPREELMAQAQDAGQTDSLLQNARPHDEGEND